MDENKTPYATIDEYIAQCPPEIRERLQAVRQAIREAAPEASEKISWAMPTFFQHGNLVHFAAHTRHVGFYPGADGIEVFKEELSEYHTSKGAAQFPYDRPMPLGLIRRITEYRVRANTALAEKKLKKKK